MDKEDVVRICNGILLSHKKEWNDAICSNMDGPRDSHTEWSKSEKDKCHVILLICGIENMVQMNLFTKQIQTHRHREQTWITKGEKGWGRDKLGVTKKKKKKFFCWIVSSMCLWGLLHVALPLRLEEGPTQAIHKRLLNRMKVNKWRNEAGSNPVHRRIHGSGGYEKQNASGRGKSGVCRALTFRSLWLNLARRFGWHGGSKARAL